MDDVPDGPVSTELEAWLARDEPRTIGNLVALFGGRLSNAVFGLLVIVLSIGAFLAPPFTGLDTLPALGAVLLSLAVLLEDVAIAVLGLAAGAAGVVLEIVIGTAAYHGLSDLF